MRLLACVSVCVALVACDGERAAPRFGTPADPDALVTALVAVGRQPPESAGVALAEAVRGLCGAQCECLGSVLPDAPHGTRSCPAANDTVPPMWPPMELAGRYLADQVAHAREPARTRILVAMGSLRVPIPRVEPARWKLPAAAARRPLSVTRALIGVTHDGVYTVVAMPAARFDEGGARIHEAADGGRVLTGVDGLRDAVIAAGKPVGTTPAAPAPAPDPNPTPPPSPLGQDDVVTGLDHDALAALLQPATGSGFDDIGLGGGWGETYRFGGRAGADLVEADGDVTVTVAIDPAANVTRLAAVLGQHRAVIATAAGARVGELPMVFGGAPDPHATAAIAIDVTPTLLTVSAPGGRAAIVPRNGGPVELHKVGEALTPAPGGSDHHASIRVDRSVTAGELIALADLALAAGASTFTFAVTSQSGFGLAGTGRRSGLPQVTIGQPHVTLGRPPASGDLDKAIIRRYVKRNIARITYCYEKELLQQPALQGRVDTRFFISATGAVTSAEATGLDDEVAACIARVLKGIEFPRPAGGGGVLVNYPFQFRPA